MDGFTDGGVDAYEMNIPRQIDFEMGLARQLDRIAFRRSNGLPWDEALYHLRDSMVGYEDEQFWDGIPPKERKRIKALADVKARKEAAEAWAGQGWETMHVRAYRVGHRVIFKPTGEQMSRQLRIVLQLIDRSGMRRKVRQQSRLPDELVQPTEDHNDD